MPTAMLLLLVPGAIIVIGAWLGYLLSGSRHREELRTERRARNVREVLARPGASGVTRRVAELGAQPSVSEDDVYP